MELHRLAAGNQEVGEFGGVLQFAERLISKELGETAQLAFGAPKCCGVIHGVRLPLHVQVLLKCRQQVGIHLLGDRTTTGSCLDGSAAERCRKRHRTYINGVTLTNEETDVPELLLKKFH